MPGFPRASIIIATYNRAGRLAACLDALARQSAPPADFEVIVVDDGSSDSTAAQLASSSTPYRLLTISQPNQGQCVALNRGAAEAQANLLIFLDDDMLASPDLVRQHLSLSERDPLAVGIGQMLLRLPPGSGWFARAFAENWQRHYDRLNAAPGSVTWRDCFGGNMSVGRKAFLRAGGFATNLARGYDLELAARFAAAARHFVYLPGARALQDERKDFRALLRDSELGGEGSVTIYRRHPETLSLIGHFPDQTPQAAVVLRALLRLDPDPALLARLLWWMPQFGLSRLCFDLLHRYAFWRGVKCGLRNPNEWEQLSHGVVFLMYHGFCEGEERASRYLISTRRFVGQMQWLKRRGYQALDLESYVALRKSHALPPARSVVITIDDGYAEVASSAVPALQRAGFPAMVFLPTSRVGQVNEWDPASELYGRRLLSWSGVRTLAASGIAFGAHGRTHKDLTVLDQARLCEEIEGAQADFERETGEKAVAFSYPYGAFHPEFAERLHAAGYEAAVSVEPGPNTPLTDLSALRRVEIWGRDSLLAFACAVVMGRELRAARRRARHTLRRAARRLLQVGLRAPKARAAANGLLTEKD